MGWTIVMNILHNNISKITDYAFFDLNQLRELDISNNAIVNLPVYVFQGLICFKGGELEINIQVIHFIVNYKIMLKAVTPV